MAVRVLMLCAGIAAINSLYLALGGLTVAAVASGAGAVGLVAVARSVEDEA